MKLMKILTAKWADLDHKALVGMAEVEGVDGEWPFAVHDGYATDLGQSIWDEVQSGAFSQVGPYEPAPLPVQDEISRRQFFHQLAVMSLITNADALAALQGGTIPAPLQAIIDQLPTENDRFEAQMFIVGAQNFNRLHPLSETVRLSLGWSVEQKDDFWREAAKL